MKTRRLAVLLGIIMLLGTLALVGVVAADTNASTYTVNYTHDQIDVNPGDNVCATSAGICTLRAAVMEANAHPGKDTIKLSRIASGSTPDVFKFLIGGTDGDTPNAAIGDLDITDDVEISGFNAVWTVIDANSKDRAFDLHSSTRVQLSNMLIRNGNATATNAEGGGIYAHGISADLRYVSIENNKAFVGGGIFHSGSELSLSRVTIKNNVSGDGFTPGGGLYNEGGLDIEQSTFSGNKAYKGGGLFHSGQGIIVNSTFSDNHANGEGGGITVEGSVGTWLDLSNVTIAYNYADDDDSNSGDAGGIYNWPDSAVRVRNSIIALNVDKSSNDDDDCYGEFQSDGYNLIGHNWLCGGFTETGDQTGGPNAFLDPKLEALAKNGGFAPTHALKSGSPAIDAGDWHGCKDKYGQMVSYDQRNYQRHVDGDNNGSPWCDIGAYEAGSHYITPTATPAGCSQKPEAATLDAPVNGSTTTKRKVGLDWTGKICTTKYKVLVKQDSPQGPKADSKTVQTSAYQTKKLAKGHTYFWRVKACNDYGCTKSVWYAFTINP